MVNGAESHFVIRDKDRRWRLGQLKKRLAGARATVKKIIAALLVALGNGKPRIAHGTAVALLAAKAHHLRHGTGNMGDTPVPQSDQVFHRLAGRRDIVDLHMRKARPLNRFERHHDGCVRGQLVPRAIFLRQFARHQDHAVGMAVAQHVEIFDLALGVVFRIAHQHGIAGGAGGRFHAFQNVEIEWVAHIPHHHQHRHGAGGAQAAGAGIGAIVQRIGRFAHARPGLTRHEVAAAQGARYGGGRNAQRLRDILDLRPPVHARSPRPRP